MMGRNPQGKIGRGLHVLFFRNSRVLFEDVAGVCAAEVAVGVYLPVPDLSRRGVFCYRQHQSCRMHPHAHMCFGNRRHPSNGRDCAVGSRPRVCVEPAATATTSCQSPTSHCRSLGWPRLPRIGGTARISETTGSHRCRCGQLAANGVPSTSTTPWCLLPVLLRATGDGQLAAPPSIARRWLESTDAWTGRCG